MDISFPDLKSFVTLSHTGNFHQAARALAVSQPTLTRRIQRIEEILGVPLFDRTTRNVTLTAVGREFLPKAEALLEEFEESVLTISGMAERAAGQINVACVPTAAQYMMPKAIKVFSARYPNIRIKIVDEPANVVLTMILSGEADLGISFGRNLGGDIAFDPLFEDPYVLACPVGHPLAKQKSVKWAQLHQYPFIRAGSRNGNRLLIDLSLTRNTPLPNWIYEVQHLGSSLPLVEAGLGISVVSTLLKKLNRNPKIAFRPLIDPPLARQLGILRRAHTNLSTGSQNFYEALKSVWAGAKV
jgi:DNA-binding transcriptional LysR family regulator